MTSEHDELPEYVLRNRAVWDRWAPDWVAAGERSWARPEPSWGVWGVPESKLEMLSDVAGLDAIELGCGTGYVSAWLARRGARPVAIDNSPKQLETARRLQVEHGLGRTPAWERRYPVGPALLTSGIQNGRPSRPFWFFA
jgi:SAM-dependent methyltransferase